MDDRECTHMQQISFHWKPNATGEKIDMDKDVIKKIDDMWDKL